MIIFVPDKFCSIMEKAKREKKVNPFQPWEDEYWEYRKKHPPLGRPKKFTPRSLWEKACEYFERTRNDCFYKQDFIRSGDSAGNIVELKQLRPYTWQGFENYLNETGVMYKLDDYRYNYEGRYEDFKGIIRAIDSVIYAQKIEGAAAGVFNANIIARELGLAEKSQIRVTEEQPLFGDELAEEATD